MGEIGNFAPIELNCGTCHLPGLRCASCAPTGISGLRRSRRRAFRSASIRAPDLICADLGSCDAACLGSGAAATARNVSTRPPPWQSGHRVPAARGAPARRADDRRLGGRHRQEQRGRPVRRHRPGTRRANTDCREFRLGISIRKSASDYLRRRMRRRRGRGARGRPRSILATRHHRAVVAMAGVHPYIELLDQGADIIIGGRSSDARLRRAGDHSGFPAGLAYFSGKVLECASFCAEPYGGKESVLGEITMDDFKVTAMLPEQRCTVASVAGQPCTSAPIPYYEYFPGGHARHERVPLRACDERTTRITGPKYVRRRRCAPSSKARARSASALSVWSGCAIPYTIEQYRQGHRLGPRTGSRALRHAGYELHYTVYGRDGILGELEPLRKPARARAVRCGAGRRAHAGDGRGGLHDRHPADVLCPAAGGERHGRVGVAFALDEVMPASPAYRWTHQPHGARRRPARIVSRPTSRSGRMIG